MPDIAEMINALHGQVRDRRVLMRSMVGQLYPSIMESEIDKINAAIVALKGTPMTREFKSFPWKPFRPGYGAEGVRMFMIVRGPKGVVCFWFFTGWYLTIAPPQEPTGGSVDTHLPAKEGKVCEFLGKSPCKMEGSTLAGEEMFTLLCSEGSDRVWKELEEAYNGIA